MPVVKCNFEPGELVWLRIYIGQASCDKMGLVIERLKQYTGIYTVFCEGRLWGCSQSALRAASGHRARGAKGGRRCLA